MASEIELVAFWEGKSKKLLKIHVGSFSFARDEKCNSHKSSLIIRDDFETTATENPIGDIIFSCRPQNNKQKNIKIIVLLMLQSEQ